MSRLLRCSFLIIFLLLLPACNLPQASGNPSESIPVIEISTFTSTPTVETNLPELLPPVTPSPTFAVAVITPPTSTTLPVTVPPSPAVMQNCDQAQFIADVTIPDGTVLNPGERFTKTWRIKNTGSCTWTSSYAVIFDRGTQMSGPAVQALPGNVSPGQTVDISVSLTAPTASGPYIGYWRLRNASGVTFSQFYVQIRVRETVDVPGSGAFAVIHVNYEVSTFDGEGYVGCPRVVAHITTNGAGTVKYHWTRSDGSSSASETLRFNSAGTENVEYKWYLGSAAGSQWVGIYIDEPNHQDFGHIDVNPCISP
ncbi:MAG TPA: NBR1-Ig-like domain-containing protein [Anaerolineales bacterium]|nr:NBR1-Ig-like domain-containing protein [Anaerolineales bacterium]